MVEVLMKTTQSHAPLSQAQTVKVFQHLEDLNRTTLRELHQFRNEWELSTSGIGDNATVMKSMAAQVQTNAEEVVKMNTRLSTLRIDVVGNAANVVALQEQGGKNTEGLKQIKEGQKLTNTNVHNLREEHLISKEEIRRLQKEVASLQVAKENIMQAKLERFGLDLVHCKEDLENIKRLAYTNQDACRELNSNLGAARADIGKLDRTRLEHDKCMEELNFKTDKLKENLELTNGVVMRLHQEHEETRLKTISNLNKNHELDVTVRTLNDGSTGLEDSIQILNQELSKHAATQNTTRERLQETMDVVTGLKNGTVNLQNGMHELSKSVEFVHNLASNTQDHLKMTNSLVLPNLQADGAFASSATGGLGANSSITSSTRAMAQTCGPSPRSKGSPRRRKEAAWLARNIGAVPDRMSWI